MPEHPQPEQTEAYQPAPSSLDDGLTAGEGSVLKALDESLSGVPRVHLREPLTEGITPVNLPASLATGTAGTPPVTPARLQLVGEIARGGMGSIFKGRDVDLGRDIAVKVLLEKHQGNTELAQRFIEEAQIAGQLQHPGVAPVYELGLLADRRPYFTMKLVKGQTLAALLAARKDVAEDRPRFLGIFAQVCQTLAYAHARGVIHRDLKPSNVMVGAFGEVQVMDWGLAKVLEEGGVADEKRARQRQQVSVIRTQRSQGESEPEAGSYTRAGSILGTPAYMAPEQARGEVDLIDERADVFGLGAILCEILTDQPPFTGKGAEAQRKAQTGKLDEAFGRLDGCGADAELIALAKRCLAAEPWDRPRQAAEVAEAVTAYQHAAEEKLRLAELERAAAEARAVEEMHTRRMAEGKAAEERKRRRAMLALTATVLAFWIIGGGVAAWWWRRRTAVAGDVEAALVAAAEHGQAGHGPMPEPTWSGPRADWPASRRPRCATRCARREPTRTWWPSWRRSACACRKVEPAVSASIGRAWPHATRRRSAPTASTWPNWKSRRRQPGCAIRESASRCWRPWTIGYIVCRADRGKVLAVVQAADESAWRRAYREATLARDWKRIEELAAQKEVSDQPPAVLYWLGNGFRQAGLPEQAVALWRQAQRRFPGDFWINYYLAATLEQDLHRAGPRRRWATFAWPWPSGQAARLLTTSWGSC